MALPPGRDFPRGFRAACRRLRVGACIWVLAVPAMVPPCAVAAAGADADGAPLETALTGATLADTLVVTAASPVGASGPSFSGLVTRIDLDDERGARDLADVLAATAGFQVRRYGAAGASAVPSLRGSAPAQIRLYLDGMPLDDAQTGLFDLDRLPLERFAALEIYRGVVPVGLGGIGGAGAVNLLTRPAQKGATVTAGAGSFGELRTSASWGRTAQDGRGGVVMLAHARRADNDFTYLDHNQTFHRSDDDTVRVRENAWLREHGFFGKAASAFAAVELGGWLGFLRRDGGRPGPIGAYASPHASVRYDRLDGHVGAGWRDDLVRLEASAARTAETLADPRGEVGFAPPGTSRTRSEDVTGRGVWSPGWNVGGRGDIALQAGVEWRGQWHRQWWNEVADPRRHRTQTTAFAVAAAGLAGGRLRVAPAWRWQRTIDDFPPLPALPWLPEQPNVRHQRDDVSPSAGATWEVRPGTVVLEAHVARTVRTPTWIELFGHRGGVTGNRELQPETVRAADLGLSVSTAGGVSVRVAVFEARTDDTIIFVVNSQRTSRAVNVGATRTRGVETEVRAGLPAGLDLRGNLTWQHGRDAGGDPAYEGRKLPYLPDVEVFVRVARIAGRWQPWLETRYQSANYRDRANTELNMVGDRVRLDLGLDTVLQPRWLGTSGSLTATVAVLNLTDERSYDIEGYPLPGRSWRAGVTLEI